MLLEKWFLSRVKVVVGVFSINREGEKKKVGVKKKFLVVKKF